MNRTTKWGASATATRDLANALGPIRSHRTVARMMGLSRSTVFYAEKTALRKILAAFKTQEAAR